MGSYRVLPEYQDDRLRSESENTSFTSEFRRSRLALLSIPAEWRQSVWASANAAAEDDGCALWDWDAVDKQVVIHATKFVDGWRPRRMETPIAERE